MIFFFILDHFALQVLITKVREWEFRRHSPFMFYKLTYGEEWRRAEVLKGSNMSIVAHRLKPLFTDNGRLKLKEAKFHDIKKFVPYIPDDKMESFWSKWIADQENAGELAVDSDEE